MAIATLVTRGFGNGTFSGTIPLVVTRGYLGEVATEVGTPLCGTVSLMARMGGTISSEPRLAGDVTLKARLSGQAGTKPCCS